MSAAQLSRPFCCVTTSPLLSRLAVGHVVLVQHLIWLFNRRVPNPPTLCSSFANWNITNGISWSGMTAAGNIITVFSGGLGAARLTMAARSREHCVQSAGRMLPNGSATANSLDPGYWGNPSTIARANAQWGRLATRDNTRVRAANAAHGTIIANGTVIFRAANGDAILPVAAKPNVRTILPDRNNIKGFTCKWKTSLGTREREFTPFADIPVNQHTGRETILAARNSSPLRFRPLHYGPWPALTMGEASPTNPS